LEFLFFPTSDFRLLDSCREGNKKNKALASFSHFGKDDDAAFCGGFLGRGVNTLDVLVSLDFVAVVVVVLLGVWVEES
jgi:branched-subunit amino acid permease